MLSPVFGKPDKSWDIYSGFRIRTYHIRMVLRVAQKTLDGDQVCQIYAPCQGLYGGAGMPLATMLISYPRSAA
jgi:hypothetical protein